MTARRGTPRISVAEWDQLNKTGLRPAPSPSSAAAPKKKPTRAEAKRTQTTKAPKVVTPPVPIRSRGPWVLDVDYLGRPMTMNDERSSSLNPATLRAVRAEKDEWTQAFALAVAACRIPPLPRVYLVFQPFYGSNVVPDPDGVSPLHKTIIDALVRSGVLVNDKREQLPLGYQVLPPVTDGGPSRMTVVVFPLP